eukprot:TRINITY_DN4666_c0_g2_i1.p1 TRINITY_DN4666_c0_g2~~TRINITY_DN4666_c0_g2_i1.p1  ORF type:complete len:775 (-),score=49.93 TRINITY_DN4666_c0_g2_i1:484-2808(-)
MPGKICLLVWIALRNVLSLRRHRDVELASQCTWAHGIYMAADNNLEKAAVNDVNELLKNSAVADAVSRRQYKLRLMIDRSDRNGSERGYSNSPIPGLGYDPGTLYAELDPRTHSMKKMQHVGEHDTDDPRYLRTFIRKALNMRTECKHTFLELWDHGQGFYGFGGDDARRGSMELGSLRWALDEGRKSVRGNQYTVVGFDACFMMSYEVLSFLAPMTHYVLASEEAEPGYGWNYKHYAPAFHGPEELGQSIIDDFMRYSNRKTLTLALVNSQKFMRFKTSFDRALNKISALVKQGDKETLARVIRARSRTYDFKSVIGLTDTIDIGSFLQCLVQEGFGDLRPLATQYNSIFAYRKNSQHQYTGLGAIFPEPDGPAAREKVMCLHYKTKALEVTSYVNFVWTVMTRGANVTPSGESTSCYKANTHSRRRQGAPLSNEEPMKEKTNKAGFSGAQDVMPSDLVALSKRMIPWLSHVTRDADGQLQLFGIGSGALTSLTLYYGTRLSENMIRVLGIVKPNHHLSRKSVEDEGFPSWSEQLTDKCGGDMALDKQSCGIFADWLPPLQLVQEVESRAGIVEVRKSLVSVREVHQDKLPSSTTPELVTIPIRYYDKSGCRTGVGTETLDGFLQGTLGLAKGSSPIKLEGWTLNAYRGLVVESLSRNRTGIVGSFRLIESRFDLSRADDSQYQMGEDFVDSTCFEYSCGSDSDFMPTDCPDGKASEPRLSLIQAKIVTEPLLVLLRGYDVDGVVSSRRTFAETSEQMISANDESQPLVVSLT